MSDSGWEKLSNDIDLDNLKLLGAGSYGSVFKVRAKQKQIDDSEFYALKMAPMDGDEFTRDPEGRIYQQIAELAGLPNIVRQFRQYSITLPDMNEAAKIMLGGKSLESWAGSEKSCQSRGFFKFYLMELCQRSLQDYLHDVKVPNANSEVCIDNSEIQRIFDHVLRGLVTLHRKKLMHRDIKPRNILQGADGTWKIGDFGLCTLDPTCEEPGSTEAFVMTMSKSQKHCGTPLYKAPEIGFLPVYDRKVDVFSLGMTYLDVIVSHANLKPDHGGIMLGIIQGEKAAEVAYETVGKVFELCGLTVEHFEFMKLLTKRDPVCRPRAKEAWEKLRSLPTLPPKTTFKLKDDLSTVSVFSTAAGKGVFVRKDEEMKCRNSNSSITSSSSTISDTLMEYWQRKPRESVHKEFEPFAQVIKSLMTDEGHPKCASITEQQQKGVYHYLWKPSSPLSISRQENVETFVVEFEGKKIGPGFVRQEIVAEIESRMHLGSTSSIAAKNLKKHVGRGVKIELRSKMDASFVQTVSILPAIPLNNVSGDISDDLLETLLLSCPFVDEQSKAEIAKTKVMLTPNMDDQWIRSLPPDLYSHIPAWPQASNLHGIMKTLNSRFWDGLSGDMLGPWQLLNVLFHQLKMHPSKEEWTEEKSELRLRGILDELLSALDKKELEVFFFPSTSPNLLRSLSDERIDLLKTYVSDTLENLSDRVTELASLK